MNLLNVFLWSIVKWGSLGVGRSPPPKESEKKDFQGFLSRGESVLDLTSVA